MKSRYRNNYRRDDSDVDFIRRTQKRLEAHRNYMKERAKEHYHLARELGFSSYDAQAICGKRVSFCFGAYSHK